MKGEHCHDRVPPSPEVLARQYGERVSFCDLRCGGNTEELEQSVTALEIKSGTLVESDIRGSEERRRYLVQCLELSQQRFRRTHSQRSQTMVSVARRRLEEAEAEQARFSRCPSAGRWDAVLCPCLLSIREAWIAFHA